MAEPEHLQKAPITEAIIDLKVKLPADSDVEHFRKLQDRLGKQYPKFEEQRMFETTVEFVKGRPEQKGRSLGLHGFFFRSDDGLNVAQFRIDGFTFNRLKPYTSWEEVFPEAYRLWQIYLEAARPEFVSRIAVRYINRLELRSEINELNRFLVAAPTVPAGVPSHLAESLMKLVVREPELAISANIIQALQKGTEPGKTAIILDIDVYKNEQFEADEDLRPEFERLRTVENRIFFNLITEETVEVFK